MRRTHTRVSLTLVTALLVLLIAVLAGSSLWVLRRMQRQSAALTAARSVVEQGSLIAARLAGQPAVREGGVDQDWTEFARVVRSLYAVENGIQYVSVVKNGVTVYQQHTRSLDGMELPDDRPAPGIDEQDVRVQRRLLRVGEEQIPVMVFTLAFAGADGQPRLVEVAIKKETLEREQAATTQAIASMFQLSLVTVVVSFAVCAALVVWIMRQEERRERLRREEEHLAFAGVMANGIVHDFRNPMSSLRLDVQMLGREARKAGQAAPERVRDLAGRVRTTLDRMDKVFQEFLYMSRPSSGGRAILDVTASVRDCLDLLAARFEGHGVQVEMDLPDTAVRAWAFEIPLRRALMNILVNAEQHSPKGSTVTVQVRGTNGEAVIRVLDRGGGISAKDRKRVFDMFYSTRAGGTGLGLFLARTAIEQCGGTVSIHGREGGGTEIRVVLSATEPAKETA